MLQTTLLKIFRCAVGVHFVSNLYDFTRFRCAENQTPQDHFRCVMVCYRTHTPQKTRPVDIYPGKPKRKYIYWIFPQSHQTVLRGVNHFCFLFFVFLNISSAVTFKLLLFCIYKSIHFWNGN